MAIQFKRSVAADLDVSKLVTAEPAFATDSKKMLVGNGDGTVEEVLIKSCYAAGNTSNSNAVDVALAAKDAQVGSTLAATLSNIASQITKLQSLPVCSVRSAAAQAAATSSITTLTFDTEYFDTDNMFDAGASTSRLYCKTAGYYVISGYASFPSAANTGVRDVFIQVNGGTHHGEIEVPPSSGDYTQLSIATILYLNVGDYVTLGCYQSSGASINVENAALQAAMIRA